MISLGNAISLAGLPIAYLNGDLEHASRLQQQLAEVGRRESVGIYEGTSLFFGGAIQMARGEQAGLTLMQQAISELHAHGWRARIAFYRCLLADAWIKAGDVQRAEDCLRTAIAQTDVRQERWCHPELWRAAGVIEAARHRRVQADRYFGKSLRSAKAMGAGSAVQRTEASIAAAS
jgi:hypothetical protein